MHKPLNCCLTLLCHKSMEERLVDYLLEHPELVTGFTISRVDGNSQSEELHSMAEQVRGRSRRIEISVVMNLDDAQALLARLKNDEPNREVAYWITPVLEFGRLA
ncbi:hypothetical protein GEOBC_02578 [Geobacteraceae bacterium]|nr:hypothetical protein GEOBC_02578 [Geobacteraceae bacterium]